jgi:hypothetical protein
VIFNWDEPISNGLPITGYKVYIRQSDLLYTLDSTLCDGLDFDVITNTACTVPLSLLAAEPFNLMLGYKIYVRVIATNAYGDSGLSEAGTSDGMEFVPDAPITLQNNPAITSDSVIGISWTDGASDGDSVVIDYKISYDQSTGNYVTLVDGLTD